jgi:hypothetical protein
VRRQKPDPGADPCIFPRDRKTWRVVKSLWPSCATTRPTALRGCAVVELEHAAETFTAPNRAAVDQGGRGRDAFIAQTLVCVRVRLTPDPSDLHGAGLELRDEKDEVPDQSCHGQHLDGGEVGRRQPVPM